MINQIFASAKKEKGIIAMKKINVKTKNRENDLTELVFILDRSGSMAGLEKDTIGGFNSLLEKQKAQKGRALVSTVLFDNDREVLHDRADISSVSPITEKDYYVLGSTALLDAVGFAIHHIGNIHKYSRREDVPSKTLFVIVTDGMENASRYYSADRVKQMIERQKEEYGWEFMFIGANIDAVETAANIGISPNCAAGYKADSEGTGTLYENVCMAVANFRSSKDMGIEWRENLNKDSKRK